jgi:hypothetical protein
VKRLLGIDGRPYPNVLGYRRSDGHIRYAAKYPNKRRCGRRMTEHLGTYETPERAYLAYLDARVEDAEHQANQWRRERDIHVGNMVRKKRVRSTVSRQAKVVA